MLNQTAKLIKRKEEIINLATCNFEDERNFKVLGSVKPWRSSDTYPHTNPDIIAEDKTK